MLVRRQSDSLATRLCCMTPPQQIYKPISLDDRDPESLDLLV